MKKFLITLLSICCLIGLFTACDINQKEQQPEQPEIEQPSEEETPDNEETPDQEETPDNEENQTPETPDNEGNQNPDEGKNDDGEHNSGELPWL